VPSAGITLSLVIQWFFSSIFQAKLCSYHIYEQTVFQWPNLVLNIPQYYDGVMTEKRGLSSVTNTFTDHCRRQYAILRLTEWGHISPTKTGQYTNIEEPFRTSACIHHASPWVEIIQEDVLSDDISWPKFNSFSWKYIVCNYNASLPNTSNH